MKNTQLIQRKFKKRGKEEQKEKNRWDKYQANRM